MCAESSCARSSSALAAEASDADAARLASCRAFSNSIRSSAATALCSAFAPPPLLPPLLELLMWPVGCDEVVASMRELSRSISAVSSRILRFSSLASFLLLTLVIFLARWAYLRVATVSRTFRSSAETVASMYVTVLPPRDSSSSRVSFDERYGM